MGDTGNVKGIFGEALSPVFGSMQVGFIGFPIPGTFYGFERKKGIVKTLEGMGETATGMRVPLTAKLEFLLHKSFFRKKHHLGIGGKQGFRKGD
jgi:hypothetical protein